MQNGMICCWVSQTNQLTVQLQQIHITNIFCLQAAGFACIPAVPVETDSVEEAAQRIRVSVLHIAHTIMQAIGAVGCQSAAGCRASAASNSSSRTAARSRCSVVAGAAGTKEVTLLDYGAGNVRSVRNAIKKLGYTIKDVSFGVLILPSRVSPAAAGSRTSSCCPAAKQLHLTLLIFSMTG